MQVMQDDQVILITLKNFRCYASGTYRVPIKGLTLLSGNSGAGKSTLLLSVIYALYGSVKKSGSFSNKNGSTTVRLTFPFSSKESETIWIERNSRPSRLLFFNGEETLEGDKAQSHINVLMGLDENEFIVSRCLVQGVKTLLSLPSNKILEMIQRLCCKDEEKKNKLKEKVREDLAQLEQDISQLEKEREVMKGLLNQPVEIPFAPPLEKVEEKIEGAMKKKKELSAQVSLKESKLSEMKDHSMKRSTLEKMLEEYRADLKKLEKNAPERVEKDSLKKLREEIRVCEEENESYLRYEKLTDKKKRSEVARENYEKKSIEREKVSEHLDKLKKAKFARDSVLESNKAKEKKIKQLEEKLKQLGHSPTENFGDALFYLKCPSCTEMLCLEENGETRKLNEKDGEAQQERRADPDHLEKFLAARKIAKEAAMIKTQLQTVPPFSEEEFSKLVEKLKGLSLPGTPPPKLSSMEVVELEKLTKKYKSNPVDPAASQNLEKLKTSLPLLEKKRREYEKYENVAEMTTTNIARVEKKISQTKSETGSTLHIEKELADLKKRVKRYEGRVQKALELKGKSLEYASYLKEYEVYTRNVERVNEITISLMKKKKEHSELTSISSCISQAELISTEEITAFINDRALRWLERFFGDQPPIVRFVLGKEIGKGRNKRVKHVLNIEIMLKGNLYDSIKFLSKGERKRVKLALLLAFSDVLDIPRSPEKETEFLPRIYLLDECLSNIDSEIQTEILIALKEKGESLFLVVSHDAVKGIFTDVISW